MLAQIVREAIEDHLDLDRWQAQVEQEEPDRTAMLRALAGGGRGRVVSAQVLQLPRRDGHDAYDPELTYLQLAAHLGVSKRFLQLRRAEGMPSCGFDYVGRRSFRLSEATAWLDARQERLGRGTLTDAPFTPTRREAAP